MDDLETSHTEQTQQESSEVGSFEEAMKRASEELLGSSEESKAEEKQETQETEKECDECGEEEADSTPLYILDKDGNKIPFKFKADGKEYAPDDPEKALQWASFGVHANQRLENLNKAEPILKTILEAYKEGRLVIKDEGEAQPSEKAEGEEELDEILDPQLAEAKREIKALKEEIEFLKGITTKKLIEETRNNLRSEIDKNREKFFAALAFEPDVEDAPKSVWDLLQETDETGRLKYTVEEAMKISHEQMVNFIKKLIEKNPEAFIDEEAIYIKKLKEKQEKEKAPVSSPAEKGVTAKAEKRKFNSLEEALQAASKELGSIIRAAKSH